MNKYEMFFKVQNDYQPSPYVEVVRRLDPGMYKASYDDMSDSVTFKVMESNHDELVDLPGTEYDAVVSDVDLFLRPETEAKFKEMGFIHKFNILLHGPPGTGKTCLVNRVAQKLIAANAIVLFNPQPHALQKTYEILDAIQPDTRVLVIFEEMDEHVRREETTLLHVLDGEIQKKNAMYIATTNYIDKIPARVRRPGRFSSVIKVGFPNAKARAHYLSTKLKDKAMIASIVERTDGFSIDELKEVVRGVYCMGKDLDSYIQYVKPNNNKQQDMDDDDDFFDDDKIHSRHTLEDESTKLSLALKRFARAAGKK
jgi:Cdc6-like AAA superfamily ATPase